MLGASSLMPLPPAFTIEPAAAAAGVQRSEQFWTPLRVCGYLLAEMIVADDKASSDAQHFKEFKRVMVGQLAEVQVTKHLLETVHQDPAAGEHMLGTAALVFAILFFVRARMQADVHRPRQAPESRVFQP
jgi:hypothetical protein